MTVAGGGGGSRRRGRRSRFPEWTRRAISFRRWVNILIRAPGQTMGFPYSVSFNIGETIRPTSSAILCHIRTVELGRGLNDVRGISSGTGAGVRRHAYLYHLL